jgi:dUTP pyrophosphatase
MRVRVREIVEGCFPKRIGGSKSDCIDLILGEDVTLKKGELYTARLGISMELPKGMIGRVYFRSSTPVKWNVSIANGLGIIDNVYSGNDDEWKVILHATKATTIPRGTRICQFEIVPSQFATRWQKIKWLLSSGIKLVKVDSLNNKDRGGIGSTGV